MPGVNALVKQLAEAQGAVRRANKVVHGTETPAPRSRVKAGTGVVTAAGAAVKGKPSKKALRTKKKPRPKLKVSAREKARRAKKIQESVLDTGF